MTKPTRNAQQLQALIQERLDAIPDLRGQRTDVQDGGIVWKDPGHEGGANWTSRGSSGSSRCSTTSTSEPRGGHGGPRIRTPE
jgi:hypothetical protein